VKDLAVEFRAPVSSVAAGGGGEAGVEG